MLMDSTESGYKVSDSEYARRQELTKRMERRGLFLNGKPTRISGFRRRFATVYQVDGGLSGQWAWPTLYAMDRGGAKTLSI